jgi:glycosyltransferase involved in cell wall biosynthesis
MSEGESEIQHVPVPEIEAVPNDSVAASGLRVACFSYPADSGCWNLTRALKLVDVDAVNCVTSHHYFDYPYWFDVSTTRGRSGFMNWLSRGVPDLVLANKHPLWERPYPIRIPSREGGLCAIWHRGSIYRNNYERINAQDRSSGLIRLASTLDLLQYSKPDLRWFPVPTPVIEYARFRMRRRGRKVRFFHSPTVRQVKGTRLFVDCIKDLKHESPDYEGLELVIVERSSHEDCMRVRGTCDVALDQVNNLCYGNSGLEACCMKMPVVVNVHPTVYNELEERRIEPWFVDPGFNDTSKLKECVKELYADASFRKEVGMKGYRYVKEWHDLPVSGRRFLSIVGVPLPYVEASRTNRKKLLRPTL